MEELTIIQDNFQYFYPCLMTIEANTDKFKKNNHPIIFSFLLGYFSKDKINFDDFNIIYNKYQGENFNESELSSDFDKISIIFCDYFERKKPKIIENNINNSNSDIFKINNNINNSDFNLIRDSNSNINSNNEKFKIEEKLEIKDNNNSSSNFNISNYIINNNYINNNNFININCINEYDKNNINEVNEDYQLAKQLEREEKEIIEKKAKEDEKLQTKKCEICLEDFSLLDFTNYFLNCNCVLHNICFDNLVKTAIESNNLPVKCPNCKIPVHPNFIEDSLRNANPQLFEKYEKFSMNNFILNNNDEYSSCPTPGCEYMFFFQPGEFNFLCPLCNKNYCLNCKDEWHRGLTCQQYKDSRDVNKLDNQFFKFVKGAKFKMCPKCKYWVEKNQGCNHMRCRCGADFCYLCGKIMDMSRPHKC